MGTYRQYSDIKSVKRSFFCKFAVLFIALLFLPLSNAAAYMVQYKEDFYRLYHVHYLRAPDDFIENIYWLEKAVRADFANPKYADIKIETKTQWEKYRYLYMMHLNLKLVEQHIRLGAIYDKASAFFYDAPWKDEYIDNLEKTKSCYEAGLYYWKEAALWAEKASAASFNFLYLEDMHYQEDEKERINNGSLDYGRTIHRELSRVQSVLDAFNSMAKKTY